MAKLTVNEQAMLRGFAEGKTYGQVAVELRLTTNQGKALAAALYRKLDVKHMAAAVGQGYRLGLLQDTQATVERDWLLAEASDEVRARFFAARADQATRMAAGKAGEASGGAD